MRGNLPWDSPQGDLTKEQFGKNILYAKRVISVESLCDNCPLEFKKIMIAYFKYVKDLKFRDTPDYLFLQRLFSDLSDEVYVDNENLFQTIYSPKSMLNKNDYTEIAYLLD